jgi:hypothetical protein
MADFVFNVAKGRVAELCALGAANDAIIAVPIETTGIVTDAVMKDYANLSLLLAGASNEQATMGRLTLTGVIVTVDNVNDRVDVNADDPVWAAASGSAISKVVICWDGDTTGGADTAIIPLVAVDLVATPNGGSITAVFNAAGFYRAA